MGQRTNTAVWLPNQNRWQIKVQKNGVRKTFTFFVLSGISSFTLKGGSEQLRRRR